MHPLRGKFSVFGTALVYSAMGIYFSSGSTAVYFTSYLRKYANSNAELKDNIWFLAAVGLSAIILPIGGWLDSLIGVRMVCLLAGVLQRTQKKSKSARVVQSERRREFLIERVLEQQTLHVKVFGPVWNFFESSQAGFSEFPLSKQASCFGIFATYFALETNFLSVVICYGGSFFLSCGIAYTAPLANINKWFPERKGLVTGIVAASMAAAPTFWTPLITTFVNPNNLPPDSNGYFNDYNVLERTRQCMLLQGFATLALFVVGVTFIFPAPPIIDPLEKKHGPPPQVPSYVSKEEILTRTVAPVTTVRDDGLTPKEAIKTVEFVLLSVKIMMTELVFFYLLFVYKPFGQTFIADDLFLSTIGASGAVGNTACRLLVGHLKDLVSYKVCCIPLSGLATFILLTLPFTPHGHPMVYGAWIVIGVSITGSQFALMPSAVTEYFGEKYASINIGLVYMSTVFADVFGALGSQYLTQPIGWTGMILIVGVCTGIDFLCTFLLPNDPSVKLGQLLKIRDVKDESYITAGQKEIQPVAFLPSTGVHFIGQCSQCSQMVLQRDKEIDNQVTRL